MTRFRFHRGMLADSLRTTVTLTDYETLEYLVRGWAWHQFIEVLPKGLRFEHKGMDTRCGWDTWYVLFDAGDGLRVAGMSDGIPDGTPLECLLGKGSRAA